MVNKTVRHARARIFLPLFAAVFVGCLWLNLKARAWLHEVPAGYPAAVSAPAAVEPREPPRCRVWEMELKGDDAGPWYFYRQESDCWEA